MIGFAKQFDSSIVLHMPIHTCRLFKKCTLVKKYLGAEKADQRMTGVTKSRNLGNTKIKHRASHVRRSHKNKDGGPQLSRQKQFSLVFVYF